MTTTNSAQANVSTPPLSRSSARPYLPADHSSLEGHRRRVGGDPNIRSGQTAGGTHPCFAAAEQSPEQVKLAAMSNVGSPVRVSPPPAPVRAGALSIDESLVLADPLLALAADVLDDLERVRVANENRLRQLTRDETDADGEERGFGLTEDHPDVKRLAALVTALGAAEHDAELNLKRQLRKHPLGAWVKQARGVGEKQAARLLAAIGDPYWNDLHDRPRLVSELWSYAGYGDAAKQVRRRGEKANWSADAKKRTWLVSSKIVMQLVKPCHRPEDQAWAEHDDHCDCSVYRLVYDDARQKYADAVHVAECKRCGPQGKPALPGSPLSAGHQKARAMRAVSKEVLRDLWREAKRLHELHDGQGLRDSQGLPAVVDPTSSGQPTREPHQPAAAGSSSATPLVPEA